MDKSTHKVEVVEVKLLPHPNADTLSVVKVFGGYSVCVRSADWQDGALGAYIPPDSIVDSSRPEFAFLAGHERIKVKKLRGIVSMGLLVPAPAGAKLGDNVAELFGVTHYEPPMPLVSGGEDEPAPPGFHPIYDVDSLRRYAHLFSPGEQVWVTEKIHGANARFCYANGEMRVGSRTTWKKYNPQNLWWRAVESYPEVVEFCKANPNITVYGEVYGQVQDLKYGTKPGEVRLAIFDLLLGTEWLDPSFAKITGDGLPWVPCLSEGMPFDLEAILALAEGKTLIPGADHLREGIVIKPLQERTDPEVGRVCLKVVSNGYLERA
jgi:RNA ligase (TIGR02306 family)